MARPVTTNVTTNQIHGLPFTRIIVMSNMLTSVRTPTCIIRILRLERTIRVVSRGCLENFGAAPCVGYPLDVVNGSYPPVALTPTNMDDFINLMQVPEIRQTGLGHGVNQIQGPDKAGFEPSVEDLALLVFFSRAWKRPPTYRQKASRVFRLFSVFSFSESFYCFGKAS